MKMKWNYAMALYRDPGATLDDLREAVTTLEDAARIARRVLGGAHPTTTGIEGALRNARAALRARETPSPARGSIIGAAVHMFVYAFLIFLCYWGYSTAPAPRAPEL